MRRRYPRFAVGAYCLLKTNREAGGVRCSIDSQSVRSPRGEPLAILTQRGIGVNANAKVAHLAGLVAYVEAGTRQRWMERGRCVEACVSY
jgi:hypothetical protein